MKFLALPRGDWPLIALAAPLFVLAYPPFHLFLPSFLCLVPAVLLITNGAADPRPLRRHLVQGFWFAFISNGFVLYWMLASLWRFTPLSVLGYVATISLLGLFGATVFGLVGWIHRVLGLSLLVSFPLFWTAHEWTVGHLGDIRFPWLGLGTSLTNYPTAVQIADLVGTRGVTLLLSLANVALALAWLSRRDRRRSLRLIAAVLGGLTLAVGYGLVRERTVPLRSIGTVVVIQPNIGREEKWQGNNDSIVRTVLTLSKAAAQETKPHLIVWPEAAVPGYFARYPHWRQSIVEHARESGAALVVGGYDYKWISETEYEYYNSAFLFDETGADSFPVYHKRYLVPVTERAPFINPRWIDLAWFGGFSEGEDGPVYETWVGRFGILICYESAFENLSRDYRRRGADFLINMTNDVWFGESTAPFQHAAHLVMRAIENRVGVARAANSGVSMFVDPLGRTSGKTQLGERTFVTAELFTGDVVTVYTRLGDWVGVLVVGFSLLLVVYAWWQDAKMRRC